MSDKQKKARQLAAKIDVCLISPDANEMYKRLKLAGYKWHSGAKAWVMDEQRHEQKQEKAHE